MQWLILMLTTAILVLLVVENVRAMRDRKALIHVIYVNGTRGKSSVSRLIDAGLRAGGWRVFCKTTGTVPMTIGVDGEERPLVRRGQANIREQLKIMHQAVGEGAQILVAECMAVDPALQYVSQHRMLRADLGVITNVRLDHTDEMGQTLDEIGEALCSTVPRAGVVFTADAAAVSAIGKRAVALDSEWVLALPDKDIPTDIDFVENVALALAVCCRVGVDRETALAGMRDYKRDPYALSLFKLRGGALFINGLSINDPQSSEAVWLNLKARHHLAEKKLVLLINNRPDRGYRTQHMTLLAQRLAPQEIWLLGASRNIVQRALKKRLPDAKTTCFASSGNLPLKTPGPNTVIFAVGNIANDGRLLMTRVKTEGSDLVP
ncbi:MAG TPA: poly-gamma-glutamate synthase PgsB [Clostridia bacterium]|nr:poly-gamma-glutamate synthase PgsB [Clostridia bacterium]